MKMTARGSTDMVSIQMDTSLRALMPFFSAPYRAKLSPMMMAKYGTLPYSTTEYMTPIKAKATDTHWMGLSRSLKKRDPMTMENRGFM